MRRFLSLLLVILLTGNALAAAEPLRRVSGSGYSLQVPTNWQTQAGLMGAELTARPPETDALAWASDLLVVTREPYDPRRTCLDGFVLRKLQDMRHLSEHFQVLNEHPFNAGDAPATRLDITSTEGARQLHLYMVVMASQGHMVTITLSSSPARFEFQRAQFRRVVDSLRASLPPHH